MAEMYGELMEFNDRLHKDVYTKNNIITTLCHSLLSAGLEVCGVNNLVVMTIILINPLDTCFIRSVTP